MTTVSKQDFEKWLRNPMTKAIQELMRQERADCINRIVSDTLILESSYPLIAAKSAAMITVYDNFLNIDFDMVRYDGYAEETKEEV